MEQSAKEEECGICLDALTNPVALPCRHKFCAKCLNGWRSKYEPSKKEMDRKCPLCREKIPPSREMVSQLKFWRKTKAEMEAEGDIFSENYMRAKSQIEILECTVGDGTKTISHAEDDDSLLLPNDICVAAGKNDIQKVLNWLGPPPVDKQRVNATSPENLEMTLVHSAAAHDNSDFVSILLQLGAHVDPVTAEGATPLVGVGYWSPDYYAQAKLLLEWGAEISSCPVYSSKDEFIGEILKRGNSKLANLVKSELGGRRCEVINMPNRPDLVGKTCVVEKYLTEKSRYKVIFEKSKEVGLVGPQNLKRRDRTPDDCGYYITFKNGRFDRRDFASKECQAFVASLNEGGKSRAVDAGAEARAEKAAASLLAELDIGAPADSERESKKRGKKKGKKKGRK